MYPNKYTLLILDREPMAPLQMKDQKPHPWSVLRFKSPFTQNENCTGVGMPSWEIALMCDSQSKQFHLLIKTKTLPDYVSSDSCREQEMSRPHRASWIPRDTIHFFNPSRMLRLFTSGALVQEKFWITRKRYCFLVCNWLNIKLPTQSNAIKHTRLCLCASEEI